MILIYGKFLLEFKCAYTILLALGCLEPEASPAFAHLGYNHKERVNTLMPSRKVPL